MSREQWGSLPRATADNHCMSSWRARPQRVPTPAWAHLGGAADATGEDPGGYQHPGVDFIRARHHCRLALPLPLLAPAAEGRWRGAVWGKRSLWGKRSSSPNQTRPAAACLCPTPNYTTLRPRHTPARPACQLPHIQPTRRALAAPDLNLELGPSACARAVLHGHPPDNCTAQRPTCT